MPPNSATRTPAPFRFNGLHTARTGVLALTRMLFMGMAAVVAAPLKVLEHGDGDDPDTDPGDRVGLYIASVVLVLLGGAFAGLTIAWVFPRVHALFWTMRSVVWTWTDATSLLV